MIIEQYILMPQCHSENKKKFFFVFKVFKDYFFSLSCSSNPPRIIAINSAASDTCSFKYFTDTVWEWPPQTLSAISIIVIFSPLSGWTVARGHTRLRSRLTLMPSSTFSPPYTSIPSSSKPISSKYSLSTTKQPIRAGLLGGLKTMKIGFVLLHR